VIDHASLTAQTRHTNAHDTQTKKPQKTKQEKGTRGKSEAYFFRAFLVFVSVDPFSFPFPFPFFSPGRFKI